MSEQDWDQLTSVFKSLKAKYPVLRSGQAWFNALYIINPQLADGLRGTEADPFYQDSNLGEFFLRLTKESKC